MNVEQPDAGNNQAKNEKPSAPVNHTDTNNQNTKIDSQDKKITLLQINNLMLIKTRHDSKAFSACKRYCY